MVLDLFKDGTLLTVTEGKQEVGKYSVLDKRHLKLAKVESEGEETLVMEFYLSGDTLTLSQPNRDDEGITFTRVK